MMRPHKTWSMPSVAAERRLIPCVLCGGMSFRPSWRCDDFEYVKCVSCGLIQRNPQPLEAFITDRYKETYSTAYRDYEIANEPMYLKLQLLGLADIGFAEMESELKTKTSSPSFLDVGCATGALLDQLRHRGWSSHGVELCAASAAYARAKALDVRNCGLENADFPDSSFDVVHASHLIEHLNRPRVFLAAARRLLKPSGRLLLTTPNADGFQARLFGPNWRSAIFDHLYLFSRRQLISLLQSEGFTVEKTISWGGLAAGTAPALIKRWADKIAKRCELGDVMMLKAKLS